MNGELHDSPAPRLVIFSGLPGVGKTTIARQLACEIEAVFLRIDTIEQELRNSGALTEPINDAGYRVAYAMAEENLRLGRTVVADCVNPILLTRNAWRDVATRARVQIVEVEVRCSDLADHRRRVESRTSDVPGLILPTWDEIIAREYHPWDREHLEVDSATMSSGQIVNSIRRRLAPAASSRQHI